MECTYITKEVYDFVFGLSLMCLSFAFPKNVTPMIL